MKLFQHYFFSFWKEKSRESLLQRDYLLETIVESPQNLYNICEAVAVIEEEEYGSKKTFVGFRQPLAFLYHTGNTKSEEMLIKNTRLEAVNAAMQSNSVRNVAGGSNSEEWFEVFISGKGFPNNLALVSSRVYKQKLVQNVGGGSS